MNEKSNRFEVEVAAIVIHWLVNDLKWVQLGLTDYI